MTEWDGKAGLYGIVAQGGNMARVSWFCPMNDEKNFKSSYSCSASSCVGVIMRYVWPSGAEGLLPGHVNKVMARAKQAGWVLKRQGGGSFSGTEAAIV